MVLHKVKQNRARGAERVSGREEEQRDGEMEHVHCKSQQVSQKTPAKTMVGGRERERRQRDEEDDDDMNACIIITIMSRGMDRG